MDKRISIKKLLSIEGIKGSVITLKNGQYIKVLKVSYSNDYKDDMDNIDIAWKKLLLSIQFPINITLSSLPLLYPQIFQYIAHLDNGKEFNYNYLESVKKQIQCEQLFTKELYIYFGIKVQNSHKSWMNKIMHKNEGILQNSLNINKKAFNILDKYENNLLKSLQGTCLTLSPLNEKDIEGYIYNIFYLRKSEFKY